jgi:outer membrane lipoprotein-sorting protein
MRLTHRSRRWLVPLAVVALVGSAGTLGPVVADAAPDLPGITAQQLLTNVQTAKVDGLSGTVHTSVDLGIPAFPGLNDSSRFTDLLSGEHTIRVAFAKPDKARVAVLDQMAERVLVTDGTTAWSYDSAAHEATKLAVPDHPSRPGPAPAEAANPQELAKRFLDAIDPSTQVTVTGTRSVAGRDAYLLTLTPRTDRTLVGSVTLAVDAHQWVPLRVTVLPRSGDRAAIDVGFTDISFDVPDASVFGFTPPPGTEVETTSAPDEPSFPRATPGLPERGPSGQQDAPRVVGNGWDAVAAGHWDPAADRAMVGQVLAGMPRVSGSWGRGTAVTTRLVSVLLTDDGRVLAGMVPVSVLEQAAAR